MKFFMCEALRHVTRRDRAAAYCMAGAILLAITCYMVLRCVEIVQSRHKPPTVTSFIDGGEERYGLPRWGRMPYLFARSQKADGTIACPPMTDVHYSDTGLGASAETTFYILSPPSCTNLNKGAVLLNFTTLVPKFGTKSKGGRGENVFEFPHPPTIDIRFAVTQTDGIDIFFAEPLAPLEAITPPWQGSVRWMQYIGGIGDIKYGSEELGQYVHTQVSKSIQPIPGIYWGLNPFTDHVVAKIGFTYSGYHAKKVPMFSKSNTSGVNFGWRITVPSSVMLERKPVSLAAQFVSLAAKFGGFMSVSSALFFIFFARKYPKTVEEAISSRLALRWRREDNREIPYSIEMGRSPTTWVRSSGAPYANPALHSGATSSMSI